MCHPIQLIMQLLDSFAKLNLMAVAGRGSLSSLGKDWILGYVCQFHTMTNTESCALIENDHDELLP